jgi:high-affinity iron transporter
MTAVSTVPHIAKAVPRLITVLIAVVITGCSGGDNTATKEEAHAPEAQAPVVRAAEEKAASVKTQGDPAAGKEIFLKHCHFCHGRKGLGDGPVGIALTPHPADFVHDKKRMAKTDAELFKSITEGMKKEIGGDAMTMPRWKEILSEKERWDVLAYVRQLEREGKEREAAQKKAGD